MVLFLHAFASYSSFVPREPPGPAGQNRHADSAGRARRI